MRSFGVQSAAIGSMLAVCCHGAIADDAEQPQQVDKVEVVGHYDTGIGTSDAASQGVVLGSTLQDLPLLRPGEVLETVPGLVVTQHSGDGKANQYFLRGYNLDHGTDFASFLDGVPANMPTNAHGQGYSDLNYLIPELVDRIDYRKGPYFADTGDFSSAGSAAIQYRKSLDRNIANITVGDDGYRRVLLAGSTALALPGQGASGVSVFGAGTPTLLGALELQRDNGPWTLKEDLQKTNALLRMSQEHAASGWSFDAAYYDASWNSTDQVPLALIESGQLGRYSALDPTDGGNTGRAIVSGEWHQRDGQGYTRLAAYLEHYRLQLWSNFTFFELRPATGDQFEQAENRNFLGGQIVRGWDHTLFGRDSVTELGLQVRHDNINVSLQNTEARVPIQTVSNNNVGETLASAYVQNTTSWTAWLRTLAGLRADHVDMDMTAYVLPQNSGSASGSKLSPKLSVILGPWEKTEFFIDAGKGFHSNDARGAIDKIDPTTLAPASAVPALAGSTGKELGLRTEYFSGLQSSVALWSLDSASELIYNADSDIGSTSPNGASRRYGVEWNNHWVNRWLLVDADVAWTHARYAMQNDNGASGDLIPNAVAKVALFRATLHDLGPWSAGWETRYIGPYPLSQDGSLTAQSATVTNLRVQRELTRGVTLSLDAINVFNRRYYDIAYEQDYRASPTSPVVPNGITVHPGEPRQLRLTLRLKF
jgi:outer membrane receptor protein involved in Fe transport